MPLALNGSSNAANTITMCRMGVAWPAVLHNTMTADPLQRLGPLSELDS